MPAFSDSTERTEQDAGLLPSESDSSPAPLVAVRFGRDEWWLLLILLVVGNALCLHYGRLGFMPLDQSIVFDGAWRMLSGQIPYRDFNTPNGLTPIMLQAGIFRLVGISWFTYCLHAALLNGFFCILAYLFLRLVGASRTIALLFGLLSGVVMYPPIGTPYLEQHAFFFILLALVMALAAARKNHGPVPALLWLGVPVALELGLLSKQIPGVFGIPLVLLILLTAARRQLGRAMLMLAIGTSFCLLASWLLARALAVDVELLRLYAVKLPAALGRERFQQLGLDPVELRESLTWPFRHRIRVWRGYTFHSIYSYYIIAAFLLAFVFLLIPNALSKRLPRARANAARALPEVLLMLGLALTCWVTAVFTNNQKENNLAYVFIAMGLVYVLTMRTFFDRAIADLRSVSANRLALMRGVSLGLVLLGFFDAYMFNAQINAKRIVHDFVYDRRGSRRNEGKLPPMLSFMSWGVPGFYGFTPAGLSAVVDYLNTRDHNFFLVGDASIIYALTGRPSTNPSLWFHPGLTIPKLGSREFARYQDQLLRGLEQHDVRYIVTEGGQTWLGSKILDFDRLTALLRESPCRDTSFGYFHVIEICPGDSSGTPISDLGAEAAD